MKTETFVAIICLYLAMFVMGMFFGVCCGKEETKQEAVKHGVAEYTSDEHGCAKFEWKELNNKLDK